MMLFTNINSFIQLMPKHSIDHSKPFQGLVSSALLHRLHINNRHNVSYFTEIFSVL
jgi:hypothetical protein